MNSIQQAAANKRSFELNFIGRTIWCEHLDGMGSCEETVIAEFLEEKKMFSRPSVSSFMMIDLDKTEITAKIVGTIADTFAESKKTFGKIAFVGAEKRWRRQPGMIYLPLLQNVQNTFCNSA